jgi:HEAT repeat-containing protein 5
LDDEAVGLLSLALSALVDASAVFPAIIETDLHACILHIFSTILSSPACQATVVSQALPVFKRFLVGITSKSSPKKETSLQIRTTLARFMSILKHAQLRENEAAIPCEKNALMACTILFTTAGANFSPADPLLEQLSSLLAADCLNSRIPSKVSASCIATLILTSKKTPADDALIAMLLPHLVFFVAETPSTEGLEEARNIATRALSGFPASVLKERVPSALALTIPTLLQRASNDGKESYRDLAQRFLECAAAVGQESFAIAVGALGTDKRALLEEVLREGGGMKEDKKESSEEPAIALKTDFLGG